MFSKNIKKQKHKSDSLAILYANQLHKVYRKVFFYLICSIWTRNFFPFWFILLVFSIVLKVIFIQKKVCIRPSESREQREMPFIKIATWTHKYIFEFILWMKNINKKQDIRHFWRFLDLWDCFLYLRPIIVELSWLSIQMSKLVFEMIFIHCWFMFRWHSESYGIMWKIIIKIIEDECAL